MAFSITPTAEYLWIELFGTLTETDLGELADSVQEFEAAAVVPNRMTDFTTLTRIEIGFPEVLVLAKRARARHLPHAIKSALVVANLVQRGFARMFQTLNDHPQITIEIFPDLPSAIAWMRT